MPSKGLSIPRLVLAGVSSGVGKTTTTIAITRALRARGLRVALFKCGPDYLDPTYHARAAGAPSQNLDGWMMGSEAVRSTFLHAARGADIALIEGVMGLFDGESPVAEAGSTAEIAKWLGAPVVLVVDASGMARSVAALVNGFATFDRALRLAGAIFNRVGSPGHLELLRHALGPATTFGGLPRDAAKSFPERHLGLVTATTTTIPDSLLEEWGRTATAWLDLDRLLALARSTEPIVAVADEPSADSAPAERRCRIGLADDAAFHFYYADNLRRLEANGAELVRFSPISDEALPDVDGVYIGGGYPEAHAEALSANTAMRAAIIAFAARGGPIYAECGGLMYLSSAIETLDGARHPMVGLLGATAVMRAKLQALGYVETETQARSILGPAGTRFRGHQFRYSELTLPPELPAMETAYSVRRRRGEQAMSEGYQVGPSSNVLASYVHAHWASNPRVASELVDTCVRFSTARKARGNRA
jgi:cobyrinic acid a,c-diamide synthase